MATIALKPGGFEDRRTPPIELGPALKAARKRAGLGLREAARAGGISHTILWQLESGRRSPSTATAASLRGVLDLSPDEAAILDAAAVDGAGHAHPARRAA